MNDNLIKLLSGKSLITKAFGNSMMPLIKSGQPHKLEPTNWEKCEIDASLEIVRIAKLNHADYKLPNFHDILSIEEEKIDKENIICNSPTIINVAKNKKKIFKLAWEIN